MHSVLPVGISQSKPSEKQANSKVEQETGVKHNNHDQTQCSVSVLVLCLTAQQLSFAVPKAGRASFFDTAEFKLTEAGRL